MRSVRDSTKVLIKAKTGRWCWEQDCIPPVLGWSVPSGSHRVSWTPPLPEPHDGLRDLGWQAPSRKGEQNGTGAGRKSVRPCPTRFMSGPGRPRSAGLERTGRRGVAFRQAFISRPVTGTGAQLRQISTGAREAMAGLNRPQAQQSYPSFRGGF